jgi:hypothetical protein
LLAHRRAPIVRAAVTSTAALPLGEGIMGSVPLGQSLATCSHHTRAEGVRLGLIMATVTWLWVFGVDLVGGEPLRTFTLLGGVFVFTVAHVLLNILYGIALVSVVHGAEREPSLVIGLTFCLITFEGAAAMLTGLLAEASLGRSAWLALFGGNVLATITAAIVIFREHPLGAYLRRAEDER